jgi:nitric oxide synthase oxygenase domain/subunit
MTTRKTQKHPGGRPPLKIDYDLVKRLASINCTVKEIASSLECSESYLTHNQEFMLVYKNAYENGKKSLRRLQWEKAQGREGELIKDEEGQICFDEKGRAMWKITPIAPDTTMQIWLGKQYLEQRDKNEVSGDKENPVYIGLLSKLKGFDGNSDTPACNTQ